MSNEANNENPNEDNNAGDDSQAGNEDSSKQNNDSDKSTNEADRIKFLEKDKENLIKSEKALKAKLKSIEENDLKKKGDIQTLLDQKSTELAELQARLEDADTWKTKYEAFEAETRKELLTGLTKEQSNFLKDLPIDKIREGRKHLGLKTYLDTDSGKGIAENGKAPATSEEQKKADEKGLTVEGLRELRRREAVREKELQEKFSKIKN